MAARLVGLAAIAMIAGGCADIPSRSDSTSSLATLGESSPTPALSDPLQATKGTLSDIPPPSAVPRVTVPSDGRVVSATPLAFEWTTRSAGPTTSAPDGSPVHWTPLATPSTGGALEFTIETDAAPVSVDLRTFAGGMNSAGVPQGDPSITLCVPATSTSPTATCTVSMGTSIRVRWADVGQATRVVLAAVWHIPASARRAEDPVDVSASWGFWLRAS